MPGAFLYDAPGGAATGAPTLLWDVDFTGVGDNDWTGPPPASLGGLTVTISDTGSPSTWGTVDGTGIVIEGAGSNGKITIEWSDIGTDLMSRALTDLDQIVFCWQKAALSVSPASTNTRIRSMIETIVGVNSSPSGLFKRATPTTREIEVWDGSEFVAIKDLTAFRTVSQWAKTSNEILNYTDTDVLAAEAPMAEGTGYRLNALANHASTAPGAWSKVGDVSDFTIQMSPAAGETMPLTVERMQIWGIFGRANEA